jgi:uncharacterized protein YlxW (UPF0749 family)
MGLTVKRILIAISMLVTSGVYADAQQQTTESLQADCNIIEGQLATQLGQSQRQVLQLKAQVADLQKQLDAAKPSPAPTGEPKK